MGSQALLCDAADDRRAQCGFGPFAAAERDLAVKRQRVYVAIAKLR